MRSRRGSIRRSLYYSILDGLFTVMMMAVGEGYVIAYAVALGATHAQIAWLAALPLLIGNLLQIGSARLTAHIGSRMRLIRWVVLGHALAWIPIIAVAYAVPRAWAPWALLAAVIVYTAFGQFAGPAWQSVMSDYIPVKKRGRYFGWRNRLQGILMVLASIFAGFFLDAFGKGTFAGFTAIFVFAMLCRFNAWLCLWRQDEPFRHGSHDVYFSFLDFVREIRRTPAGRLMLFVSLMTFAVNLSSPFLVAFVLRDLEFRYAHFMAVFTSATIASLIFQKWWGAYGDLTGNVRMLRISAWGVAALPLLWMVSRDFYWLLFVQFVAGVFWGGFSLLQVNFMLEAVPAERRIRMISYFNVMASVALILGSMCGAVLIQRLPPLFGHSFLALFLLSCLFRVVVMLTAGRGLREFRETA